MNFASLTFEQAVAGTADVKGHWRPGLQALVAADRGSVKLNQPGRCGGSLYLDGALAAADPHGDRWDYAIQHDGQLLFVEVHPADGDHHVTKMVAKLGWLKRWLGQPGNRVSALPKADSPYRWVHTGRFNLNLAPNSRYLRLLQQSGLARPVRPLPL